MPRRGENVFKRKDGRWEARYKKGKNEQGKTLYGYVYDHSYSGVKKKMFEAIKKDADLSDKADSDALTIAQVSERWLTMNRTRIKESTMVKYYNCINKHILPALGSVSVERCTSAMIEEFSNKCLKGETDTKTALSSKTVKDILVILNSILKFAKEDLGIPMDPIKIIYPKEYKKEMKVLSDEQQARLVSELLARKDECSFGILIAMSCGLRIGEICALKWKNIDLKRQVITVDSTMQRLQQYDPQVKTKIVIQSAKSSHSMRVIPINDSLASLCLARKPTDEQCYVLTGSSRHFMEPRCLQYRFKKLAESCGIEDIHFHTLRHTFATRCAEAGFEVKSLSEILGHANTKITLERYIHSSLKMKRENMEKISIV